MSYYKMIDLYSHHKAYGTAIEDAYLDAGVFTRIAYRADETLGFVPSRVI
jgi:hypothetical protein